MRLSKLYSGSSSRGCNGSFKRQQKTLLARPRGVIVCGKKKNKRVESTVGGAAAARQSVVVVGGGFGLLRFLDAIAIGRRRRRRRYYRKSRRRGGWCCGENRSIIIKEAKGKYRISFFFVILSNWGELLGESYIIKGAILSPFKSCNDDPSHSHCRRQLKEEEEEEELFFLSTLR
jgi:hypothetical protein